MYPDKHFQDGIKSVKKGKVIHKASIAVSFVVSLFVIGPFIHELAHIGMLLWQGCRFSADFGWALAGFRANVKPLCSINGLELGTFYLIGYVATVSAGGILEFIGSNIEKGGKLISSSALGILLSVVVSVGWKGDISNALRVLNSTEQLIAVLTVTALLTLYFALRSTDTLLLSERKE